ncbi:exodeoxyribonuclease VII large subunit [Prevotella sp. tf2-5]|uniref:exodeoxyribonuclease VII large subunit n=1 Tax=Prevotella sp. tf2-5 TaxID=1761889 RepID=UPI0008EAD955|nr:exodeoxyribonuclease VII large subunit [Prevotella sp. tf2-5]SFO99696.1 Exonuclease VII, large subunit [Prevotella sp. tf2-5]
MQDNAQYISQQQAGQVVKYYKPSELLGMFTSYLSQQDMNKQLIFLQGIYLKNPKHDTRWSSRYDILRDENTQTEITLQIPYKLCEDLKDGNLVTVGGVLGRRVQNNSHIQLMLVVSRVEVVQEQAIDENEIKRMELRRQKSTKGFKNVDSILEQLLFIDQRPKVALVFAATSITMSDFNAGIQAAKAAIDFEEYRVNFSNSQELCQALKNIDTKGYNVIAIIRGGGGGIEKLDELEVLETVGNMKTAIIAAIGHVEEKLFIKQLADKEAPTPNGLGQYFSDMVETVSEKKTKSRAALTEQIKKQFKDQLEAGQKQNKELQEKLTKLTKTQEETQKQHKEQVEKANKQNEELQKKLTEITKANETAQKAHAEQLGKLQVQLKAQTEASSKQSKEFNESLKKMQETNGQLQKSMEKLTAQNTQANKDLNEAKDKARQLEKQLSEALSNSGSTLWKIIAIIAAIAFFAVLLFK